MDDDRFDSVSKTLRKGGNRRSLLKAMLGIGAVTATGAIVHGQTEAARRGFSGPHFPWPPAPTPTTVPICEPDGGFCSLNDPEMCCSQKCIFNPNSPTGGYCIP